MNKIKILIVDDRKDNLIALEKILKVFDVEIIKAFSGNDALQLMIEYEFALVLMDVQMPEMDGFEVVTLMRNDNHLENTPVIFLSAIYRDEIYSIKGIERGAVDFIVKPIIPEVLIGKVRIFINLYKDKVQLKELNDELNRTQKAFIKAQQIGLMGNFTIDMKSKVMECSQVVFDIHEINNDENFTLSKYKNLIGVEDRDLFSRFLIQNTEANIENNVSYKILTKSGQKWIRLANEVERDVNGTPLKVFGIMQDITSVIESEKSLKWELLVNKAITGVANNLVLPGFDLEMFSVNLLEIILCVTESSEGYITEYVDRKTQVLCHAKTSIFNYESFDSNRFCNIDALRNNLTIPVSNLGGELGQILIGNRESDYTEKHRLFLDRAATLYALGIYKHREEIHRSKMESDLRQSEKMQAIGQLVGGIAHDFNNVLSGIMGASQLLNMPNRNLDDKSKNYVDMIIQASTRASDLINKLLLLSRKGEITLTDVDMHKVIDESISILSSTLDKKLTIETVKKADSSIINADFSALVSVIINICINASHAMKDEGIVKIKTENISLDSKYCQLNIFPLRPGKYMSISISDSGNGISNEVLEKIYEPFFTTKGQGEGTGLGLAVVYGTIESHHGEIKVDSELGVGTIFTINIPCTNHFLAKEQESLIRRSGTGTILFVDDEELNRVLAKDILESLGYTVLVANDGAQSVEIFKERFIEIDLVIMDMVMPIMNGTEAFYKMKDIDPNCSVVISSGFTKDEDINKLTLDGLKGMINKPFTIHDLSLLISKLLK